MEARKALNIDMELYRGKSLNQVESSAQLDNSNEWRTA